MELKSDATRPADRGAWQFSLRQCLAAVAVMAVVCAAYRLDSLVGWIGGTVFTVPLILFAPFRGLWSGVFVGGFIGALAFVIAALANNPTSVTDPSLIGWAIGICAPIGATLGAATSLFKDGRNGWLFLFLFFAEFLGVIVFGLNSAI